MNTTVKMNKVVFWGKMYPINTVVFLVSGRNKELRSKFSDELYSQLRLNFRGEIVKVLTVDILYDYNLPPEFVVVTDWKHISEVQLFSEFYQTQYLIKINIKAGEDSLEETDLTNFLDYDIIVKEEDFLHLEDQINKIFEVYIKGD